MGGGGVWRWGKRESVYIYRYPDTTETIRLIRDGENGGGGMEVGEEGECLYLSLPWHHWNHKAY